jgi:hypothetical protein
MVSKKWAPLGLCPKGHWQSFFRPYFPFGARPNPRIHPKGVRAEPCPMGIGPNPFRVTLKG